MNNYIMNTTSLKILSTIFIIVTHRSLINASTAGVTNSNPTTVTTQPTTTETTTPVPTLYRNAVSVSSVPEWFLLVLAVLLTLLLLTAIAGLIWWCCCKATSVSPGVGSARGSGNGCCQTRRRDSVHHYHNDSRKLQKVVNHHTAIHSITGQKRTVYPMDEMDGVYTTNNGLILIPVQPQEVNGFINSSSSPPKRNVHTIKRYDNTTSRSDNGSNDLKKVAAEVPKWMPHTHSYRHNNTSTH